MRLKAPRRRAISVLVALGLAASACSNSTGNDPAASVQTGPPALVDTIELGTRADDFALDAKRGVLYILPRSERDDPGDSVLVVDVASKKVTKTISTSGHPTSVAVDPELHVLYVVTAMSDTDAVVNVVDTETETLKDPISLGGELGEIAADTATHAVYVGSDGGVEVLDGRTHERTATIPAVWGEMAVDPANKRLYLGHQVGGETGDNGVFVIDTATNKTIADVSVNGYVDGVAVDPDTHTIYVADSSITARCR